MRVRGRRMRGTCFVIDFCLQLHIKPPRSSCYTIDICLAPTHLTKQILKNGVLYRLKNSMGDKPKSKLVTIDCNSDRKLVLHRPPAKKHEKLWNIIDDQWVACGLKSTCPHFTHVTSLQDRCSASDVAAKSLSCGLADLAAEFPAISGSHHQAEQLLSFVVHFMSLHDVWLISLTCCQNDPATSDRNQDMICCQRLFLEPVTVRIVSKLGAS